MGKLLPPVLVAQRKDTQLHMLITKEEHAMMKAKARLLGVTGVDFIRMLIVQSEVEK